jgi:hypothetical protein
VVFVLLTNRFKTAGTAAPSLQRRRGHGLLVQALAKIVESDPKNKSLCFFALVHTHAHTPRMCVFLV